MLLNLVQIGSSKGICIPKAILEQCEIDQEVELDVEGGAIVLKPPAGKPRDGWEDAFKRMAAAGDDKLLIDDALGIADLHQFEW